jgi:glutathione S-transferase
MQHTQSAPKSGLVLYTNEASGNAYKVRLLIALLGLQVDEIQVDLSKGEQREPAFRSINPRGEIPVLLDGDKVRYDHSYSTL